MLALLVVAACVDVPQPYELEHPRVMAIRLDPPAIAEGETSRITVLVTDGVGPRVADPGEIDASAPFGVVIARDELGWYATATATLETIVPISLTIEMRDEAFPAQKTLAIGSRADNPPAPVIVGIERLVADEPTILSVVEPDPTRSYRWFSSVGDLTGYTRAEAELEPISRAGEIVVVVRDQVGGTAWTIAAVEVAP